MRNKDRDREKRERKNNEKTQRDGVRFRSTEMAFEFRK